VAEGLTASGSHETGTTHSDEAAAVSRVKEKPIMKEMRQQVAEANKRLAPYGVSAGFVPANDDTVDDEIMLM
jgi:hypothetical protein